MFTHLTNPAKGFLFFAIAFTLTLIVSLLVPTLGEATMLLHMYTPTLAALIMLLVVTRDGYAGTTWRSLGLHRAGLRSWPLALVGPVVMLSVVYGLVWANTRTPCAGQHGSSSRRSRSSQGKRTQ